MRTGSFTLLILTGLVFYSACTSNGGDAYRPPDSAVAFTVATWNIHSALGADGTRSLERVAESIAEAGADIIALQEVDRGTKRSGGINQAEALAEMLGMEYRYGPANRSVDGGSLGNAVLSRYPIIADSNPRLPGSIFRVPRRALRTRIRLTETGSELIMISTHFSLNKEDRSNAAAWLNSRLSQALGPVLIGGDLNARPKSAVLKEFSPAWLVAEPEGPGLTWPASDPRARVDYLLARPREQLAMEKARTLRLPGSDHRMVIAEARLLGAGE